MTGNRNFRDPRTGRFAPRRPVPDVDAESRFNPMADSIEDIDNVSAHDVAPGMETPRPAPESDELAQGDAYPPGTRRQTSIHADDITFHNGTLRSAVRHATPADMDPSEFLVGLDQPAIPAPWPATTGTAYGDEHGRTMSPVRSEDVAPGRGRRR